MASSTQFEHGKCYLPRCALSSLSFEFSASFQIQHLLSDYSAAWATSKKKQRSATVWQLKSSEILHLSRARFDRSMFLAVQHECEPNDILASQHRCIQGPGISKKRSYSIMLKNLRLKQPTRTQILRNYTGKLCRQVTGQLRENLLQL